MLPSSQRWTTGRPPQSHTGEDGQGPIIVEIVLRNRERNEIIELPALEHVPVGGEK